MKPPPEGYQQLEIYGAPVSERNPDGLLASNVFAIGDSFYLTQPPTRPFTLVTAVQVRANPTRSPLQYRAADMMADAVQDLIERRVIDARSPAADALLDYRHDLPGL